MGMGRPKIKRKRLSCERDRLRKPASWVSQIDESTDLTSQETKATLLDLGGGRLGDNGRS